MLLDGVNLESCSMNVVKTTKPQLYSSNKAKVRPSLRELGLIFRELLMFEQNVVPVLEYVEER